jgi:polyferredoxin
LAVFVIVDGFTGRQLAPRNVATTSVWLHYRGLVVIALALFGNAFCAACPLMLTRGLTRWLERRLPRKYPWPKALKNKYLIVVILGLYFFSYEYFDLWASPWLTAWLAVGYFAGRKRFTDADNRARPQRMPSLRTQALPTRAL